MNNQCFVYPKIIKFSKLMCMFFILMSILSIPFLIVFIKPEDFNSGIEYILAIFSGPSLLIIGSIHYMGSWSEIQVDEDGISIDFLWLELRVPWRGINRIEHVGSKTLGVTILLTDNQYLTFFHRLYSLFSLGSFQPGVEIHPYYLIPNNFIDTIKMAKSSK